MDAYKDSLTKAVGRTRSWGLETRGSTLTQFYLDRDFGELAKPSTEVLVRLSREFAFPVEQRPGSCAPVHLMALAMFYEMGLPFPPVLTIGNVMVDGKPRYTVSRQGLRPHLREGTRAAGTIFVHMWLTWADSTILDLTILPALAREAGEPLDPGRPDGLALIGQPQELKPRFTYLPSLVGTAFVWAVGAVQGAAETHFKATEERWLRQLGEAAVQG